MKKILFLVDNINRDFKSNALIARHLENNGWTVRLSGIGGNEYEIANQFRPDYIVVPKFNYDPVFQILWCLKGIKIILLDTEGNAIDQYTFRIILNPDLLFFWNKRIYAKYYKKLRYKTSKSIIIGSPRTDILHPIYRPLIEFDAKRDLKDIKLSKQTVITIATAAQDVDRNQEYIMKKQKRRQMLTEKTIHFSNLINYKLDLRNLTERVIQEILLETNCIIILKPHPREEINYWINFIDSINSERIFLIFNESIETMLHLSNIHFSFEGCTTSFESSLMRVPTAELKLSRNDEVTDAFEKISICKDKIITPSDAIKFIRENINMESSEKLNSRINSTIEVIEKSLGQFTGNSCIRHAEEIIEFDKSTHRFSFKRKGELMMAIIKNCFFLVPRIILHFLRHKKNLKSYSRYFEEHSKLIDKPYILSKELNNIQRLKTSEEYDEKYQEYCAVLREDEALL